MFLRLMRRPIVFLALFLLTALLSIACQNPAVESPDVGKLTPGTTDCRDENNQKGKAEECGAPQRVEVLSPHILDSVLSLGAQPSAYAQAGIFDSPVFTEPEEQIPYMGAYVTTQPVNLGSRRNPSIEALAQSRPDLILGEKWHISDQYDLLSQIAPTMLFSDVGENDDQHWRHSIKGVAQALGREKQAEELLANYSKELAIARKQLAPVVAAHPRIQAIAPNDLAATIYLMEDSTAANLLREIGFEIVTPEASSLLPDGDSPLSIEALPQIEADLIFVMAWSEDEQSPKAKIEQQWYGNPLLTKMPASKEGRVFFVDYFLWGSNTRGPITHQLLLKELPKILLPTVGD